MKSIFFLFSLFISISFFAQIENLPELEKINGVHKTIVDKKLYPLLLKMNISESKNAEEFKNLIANLNHFEVYDSKKENSGEELLDDVNDFLASNNYKQLQENVYEKVSSDQKELIIVKKSTDSIQSATILALTTTKNFQYNSLSLL